jgi:hypothetical protein
VSALTNLAAEKVYGLSWIWFGMVERVAGTIPPASSHLVNEGITDTNSSQELAVIQIFGPEDFTS